MTLAHWDEVKGFAIPDEVRPLGGHWQRLADAAGSVRLGTQRVSSRPGQMITPPHMHSAEEEIFHVLERLGDAVAGRLDVHRANRRHDRLPAGVSRTR